MTEFNLGDYVQVSGLINNKELNGKIGKVMKKKNKSGRLAVQFASDNTNTGNGKPKLIKAINLQEVPPIPRDKDEPWGTAPWAFINHISLTAVSNENDDEARTSNETQNLFCNVIEICHAEFLKYLTVRETCMFAACSKRVCLKWAREEIRRRSIAWLEQTSRAWQWIDRSVSYPEMHTCSADDFDIDDHKALETLNDEWRSFGTPRKLLETVAYTFCGGWAKLLDVRENGAPSQPNIIARGQQVNVKYVTLGDDWVDVSKVLMFDIYCEGKNVWSGVKPLEKEFHGSSSFRVSDLGLNISQTCADIDSSKTLGDKTDAATIHTTALGNPPPRYLLSTDANDKRNWTLNVSLLTAKSLETLLFNVYIVPHEIVKMIGKDNSWEKDSGYAQILGFQETYSDNDCEWYGCNSVVPDENLWRCKSVWNLINKYKGPPKGIGEDGEMVSFQYLRDHTCFWFDRRNGKNRLHVTMEFTCEDSLFSDMILRSR